MSVLNYAGNMMANQVSSSLAHLMERNFRFIGWSQGLLMGNGKVPCDPWSCPTADGTIELESDSTGELLISSYDLACVEPSNLVFEPNTVPPVPIRIVYINLLSGNRQQNHLVYLHNTCDMTFNPNDPEATGSPVRVVLLNNGAQVVGGQSSLPSAGYWYWLVAPGDLRYILITGDGVTDSSIVTMLN